MLRNTMPKGGLLLAGLAALAYYKYSKMSEEEKRNLSNNIKARGRKFYDQYIPDNIKNLFGKKDQMNTPQNFEAGSSYMN